jgi:hypothetical protein
MSRPKLFLVGVTAMIAVPLVACLVLKPRITAENYHQIHDGMNLADVQAILGRPVGDPIAAIGFLDLCIANLREEYAAFQETDEGLRWEDRGGTILIGFRPGGTVTYKRYDPRHNEPILDKFRRWLAKW